jgi:hypothetical protein
LAGRDALANFSAGLSRLKRQCPKQAAVYVIIKFAAQAVTFRPDDSRADGFASRKPQPYTVAGLNPTLVQDAATIYRQINKQG